MLKKTKLILFLLFLPTLIFAVGPGKGTITKEFNKKIAKCVVESITLKYSLDSLFGEAIVNAIFKVSGPDPKCQLPSSTKLWIKIKKNDSTYAYLKTSPTVPKTNNKFGFNSSGSPSWKKILIKDVDLENSYLKVKDSKDLWRHGKVSDFTIRW